MDGLPEITRLLRASGVGGAAASNELYEHVYAELHARARRFLPNQQHTLQATALVNEAYLRMAQSESLSLEDREHFFAVSAKAMRQILVDHARSKQRLKRGGGAAPVPLDEAIELGEGQSVDLLELDEALTGLAGEDPRLARVVELRFFAGLSVEETAGVLGVGTATVKRDWRLARMWLLHELSDEGA